MADYDPKMIDALAAAAIGGLDNWMLLSLNKQELPRAGIRAALSALPLTPEALNALWRGGAVVALPGSLSQDVMRESWMHRKGDTVKREMWVNEADYLRAYFADTKKE